MPTSFEDIKSKHSWNVDRSQEGPRKTLAPPPGEVADSEHIRIGKRVAIRRAAAASRLASRLHDELVAEIAKVEDAKEGRAAAHVIAAAPLQTELSAIKERGIAAGIEGREADPADDQRRRELLTMLAKMNADLEGALADDDRLISELESQRIATAMQIGAGGERETDLFRTASPESQGEYLAAQSSKAWALARYERAQAGEIRTDTTAWRRVSGALAEAEVRSASAQLELAQREFVEARRRVLEED